MQTVQNRKNKHPAALWWLLYRRATISAISSIYMHHHTHPLGIEGLAYLKSHFGENSAIRFDMVNEEWQDPKEALAIWPILRGFI